MFPKSSLSTGHALICQRFLKIKTIFPLFVARRRNCLLTKQQFFFHSLRVLKRQNGEPKVVTNSLNWFLGVQPTLYKYVQKLKYARHENPFQCSVVEWYVETNSPALSTLSGTIIQKTATISNLLNCNSFHNVFPQLAQIWSALCDKAWNMLWPQNTAQNDKQCGRAHHTRATTNTRQY